MNLGELVVQLGVKADTFTVKEFKRAVDDIPVAAAAGIASLAGLSLGFVSLTNDVLNMTSGLRTFTAETGLNSQSLQQWQQVLKQAGLSPDIATSSFQTLANMTAKLRMGGGLSPDAAKAMSFLGMSMGDLNLKPDQMLNAIQSGAQGKRAADVSEALRMMGLSPELMVAFQTSRQQRESLTPTMSQGQIDQMAGFQKELAQFNQIVMRDFVKALVEVEPYMADLAHALGSFVELAGKATGGTLGFLKTVLSDDPRLDEFIQSASTGTFDQYKRNHPIHNETNVTQHIHSAADAESVAMEAAHQITRAQNRKAAGELNKAGQ